MSNPNDRTLNLDCEVLKTFQERNYGKDRLALRIEQWSDKDTGKTVGPPKITNRVLWEDKKNNYALKMGKSLGFDLKDIEFLLANVAEIRALLSTARKEPKQMEIPAVPTAPEKMAADDDIPF